MSVLPRENRGACPAADPPGDDRISFPARRQEDGRPVNEDGLGEDERPSPDERPIQDDPRAGRPRNADRPGDAGRLTLAGRPSADGERLNTDPPNSDRPIRVLPNRELRIRGLPPREPPSREPPSTPPCDRELNRIRAWPPRAPATPAPWPANAAPSALPLSGPPRPSRRFGSRLGLGLRAALWPRRLPSLRFGSRMGADLGEGLSAALWPRRLPSFRFGSRMGADLGAGRRAALWPRRLPSFRFGSRMGADLGEGLSAALWPRRLPSFRSGSRIGADLGEGLSAALWPRRLRSFRSGSRLGDGRSAPWVAPAIAPTAGRPENAAVLLSRRVPARRSTAAAAYSANGARTTSYPAATGSTCLIADHVTRGSLSMTPSSAIRASPQTAPTAVTTISNRAV